MYVVSMLRIDTVKLRLVNVSSLVSDHLPIYIELIFDDAHQEKSMKGWTIEPQLKPCKVSNI